MTIEQLPTFAQMIQFEQQLDTLVDTRSLETYVQEFNRLQTDWTQVLDQSTNDSEFVEAIDVASERISKLYQLGGSLRAIVEGLIYKAKYLHYQDLVSATEGSKITDKKAELYVNNKICGLVSTRVRLEEILKDLSGKAFSYRSAIRKSYY
jgi:hypothetical protein